MTKDNRCPHCGKEMKELRYTEEGYYTIASKMFDERSAVIRFCCPVCNEEIEYSDLPGTGTARDDKQ